MSMLFQVHCGSRCVHRSALKDKRVAIWGFGREGQAAYAYLRKALPELKLCVFCNAKEAEQIIELKDALLDTETNVSAESLSAFDVVIKSPGISKYAPEAIQAREQGTQFIGGTTLWFAEHPDARTICVTGTKGKSTVSSLIAHLLRSAGKNTALVGNIGMPLLEVMETDEQPEFWVIEMSSYQTFEAVKPEVAVMLNFFPEHLDWHGSEQAYFDDKSALITQTQAVNVVLNITSQKVAELSSKTQAHVHWFNTPDAWHAQGHFLYKGTEQILDLHTLPMPGDHNAGNVCAALTAIDALGIDARELVLNVQSFKPLPHRLQSLGTRDGIEYINDSISTTPYASIAALECFSGRNVAILVGGYDRGLDWQAFVEYVSQHPPVAIITMGQNGPRIFQNLLAVQEQSKCAISQAADLSQALSQAKVALQGEGIVLLSPGAPSFGQFTDYVERGRAFAELAGFDPNAISKIPGLGLS
jgi:UDP-N-acetylmuramoylalanine--D-glutamate ligase